MHIGNRLANLSTNDGSFLEINSPAHLFVPVEAVVQGKVDCVLADEIDEEFVVEISVELGYVGMIQEEMDLYFIQKVLLES